MTSHTLTSHPDVIPQVERYQQLVHERNLQHERWEEQRALLVTTHERCVLCVV